MKLLIIILIITAEFEAQQNLRYGDDELFFYQDEGTFTYKIIPISKVIWDNTGVLWDKDEWGRSVFDPLSISLIGYVGTVTNINGMDYILSSEQNDIPVFGNGLYKILCLTGNLENSSFYLDTRDCNYPSINSEYAYNDFTIKYMSSEKKFYIANGKGVPFNSSLFQEVTNQVVALWEVEGIDGPNLECFNNYWGNFLGISDYYNFPRLIWGLNQDFNATGYKIFRAIGNSSGLSKVNYSLIATTYSNVFEYVDEAIDLSDSQFVFYYVAAYNSSTNQNSQLTNLVSAKEIANKWKASLLLDTSVGINPHLYWSEHPTFEATNYKIYRAISSVPNPRALTYLLIHTTSSADVFEYTDTNMMLGNSDYVFYYVKASNTNTESEASNVQTTRAGMYKQGIESEENTEIFKKFVLNENYPNPFNPSTVISYQIPEASFVTLKVYDVLGREVATLVNEEQAAGLHHYTFYTLHYTLSSGIYFYTLKAMSPDKQAGSFSETKKMILLR